MGDKSPEEKKRRGRPPKNKNTIDINESSPQIQMSEEPKREATYGYGDISKKMRQIFGKMQANNIPYSNYAAAINRQKDGLYNSIFLSNPYLQNERIKKSNTDPILHNKSEIRKAFENVNSNELEFRQTSMALYYSNYVYGNLLRLNRDVPQFFHYVIPQDIKKEEFRKEEFKKEIRFVNDILDKFNLPFSFKNIALQTSQEGKTSYVFRTSCDKNKKIVDYALLQKLPPEHVKYTGYGSDSPLIVSFNFLMFLDPRYNINQWPSWFGDIWKKLQEEQIINLNNPKLDTINLKKINGSNYQFEGVNGTYFLYVELPQDLVYTFGQDFSNPLAMPEYVGLFEDLTDLDAYKIIQSQSVLTNITSILTSEVPVEKDAKGGSDAAILSPEVIMGLEGDCAQAVNSTVYPFFGPLQNFKLHQVDNIPNAMDIVLENLRNLISTAGVSGLVATTDKPSIAMIKAAQYLFESKMEYLNTQFEKFLNIVINKYFGLKHRYKVVVWGGCYTWRDEVGQLKDLVANGHKGFLPRLLSAYDMTLDEYKSLYDYVDYFEIFDEKNQNDPINKINKTLDKTTSSTGAKVGRPKLDDDKIENDNTESSRDGGENDSANK